MIEGIKEWINSLLCLGIFTAIVELAMPKGNVKKYIYVIIGIVTVITIISPIISKEEYEEVASEAIETIADNFEYSNESTSKIDESKYLDYQKEMIKNEYINNLKKSIWNDLTSEGVILEDIEIQIGQQYDIEMLKIIVKEYSSKGYTSSKDIYGYIEEYYDIPNKSVTVNEEVDIYE